MDSKFLNKVYKAAVTLYGCINSQDLAKIIKKMNIKISKKEIDDDLKNKFFLNNKDFEIYKIDKGILVISDPDMILDQVIVMEDVKLSEKTYFLPSNDINEFLEYGKDKTNIYTNETYYNDIVGYLADKGVDSETIHNLITDVRFELPCENIIEDYVMDEILDEEALDDENLKERIVNFDATVRKARFKGFTFQESINKLSKSERRMLLRTVVKDIISDALVNDVSDEDIDKFFKEIDIENVSEEECISFINSLLNKEKLPEA